MTELGTRLLAARKAAELSQQALADLLPKSITRATINNLETGRKKTADVYELMYIADALGCSFLAFVPGLYDRLLGEAWKFGYDTAMEDVRRFTRGEAAS